MNKIPENELKRITEEKGFEYIGVEYMSNKHRKTSIKFICPNHREKGVQFKLLADMKKSNGKCNYCNGHKRTHSDFVEIMKGVNPNIEFLSEYKNAKGDMKCRCLVCGYEWISIPNRLLYGAMCPSCYRKSLSIQKTKTHDTFKKEIDEKFQGKIILLSEYTGSHDKVKCQCEMDGTIWETSATTLLTSKVGCPACNGNATRDRCVKSNEQFIAELKAVNPDIEPLEEYHDDHSKVKCRCKIHNYMWDAMPNKILHRRTGCPKCTSYHNEKTLDCILEKWDLKYSVQKRFKDCKDKNILPFDRYLDDFNVLIEYDGEGHFHPIPRGSSDGIDTFYTTQKHDKIKDEYCKKNKIPLIRIPYWEKENMEYYLFDQLVKKNIFEEI